LLGYQYRKIKKLGSLSAPSKGKKIEISKSQKSKLLSFTKELKGYIVWSSNRYGNHDILMMSFPDLFISRLTNHSHTETYPRISPDGKNVVFCRSQIPWVSQRDYIPWDVYLLDIKTKEVSLVAKNANTPTWSNDGKKVYFQRRGFEFIEHDLETKKEKVLFKNENYLETPHYSNKLNKMAVTIRGRKRMTAVYSLDGKFIRVGGGCQLTWAHDYSYLYFIDHGGMGQNALYKYLPNTQKIIKWLDLLGSYSHEYFPKLSNTSDFLVIGASSLGHEHDTADYEIFLWEVDSKADSVVRITYHTGNDCWPDIFLSLD
ncbi:hypothetical protein BVX93_02205, partial [bacterium B13(2017)]